LLSGCASRKKRRERRAQRKIERARELAPQMFKFDTVVVHDTIVVERVQVDTFTKIHYHDTTVIVNNDRVVARYFYDTTRMEIHHQIECKEIHKPIETRVVVEKFEMLSWFERNSGNITWLIIIALIVTLLLRYLIK
jgi:hypothetical protein